MKAIVAVLTLVAASTTLGFTYKNDPSYALFKK